MSDTRPKKREKIDFLLENSHYRKLHLYLYLTTILFSVLVYFLIINIFSAHYKILMTAIASLLIGLFLVFNREKIVKKISEKIHEKSISKRREENKRGLEKTINRIKPSHKINKKLKLNIGGEQKPNYLKEKFSNIKNKLSNKKELKEEYIEIK